MRRHPCKFCGSTKSHFAPSATYLRGTQGSNQASRLLLELYARTRQGLQLLVKAPVRRLARFLHLQNLLQFTYLPAVRGLLAARRGNGQEAVEDLYPLSSPERVIPLDWVGPYMAPVYLRGETHLALHQAAEAVTDFQMLIDNAGLIVNCPIGALAHLGLGRAHAMLGDTTKARASYQDFLALWKDADPDIPILKQAKAEYAKLQ